MILKRVLTLLVLVTLFSASCVNNIDYGKKIEKGEGILYYKDNVTDEEAMRLVDYLYNEGIFSIKKKSNIKKIKMQLSKPDNIYILKFIVREDRLEDDEYSDITTVFLNELSDNVFKSKDLEIHFCDNKFNTLKIIKKDTSRF